MCLGDVVSSLTLLFLSDLLHQTSDLDVLLPLFTSRGCCTTAFWENKFLQVMIKQFVKEQRRERSKREHTLQQFRDEVHHLLRGNHSVGSRA